MSTGLRPTEGRPATDGSWRVTVGLALTRGLVAQHSGRWSRSEALGLELDNIGQRYGDSGRCGRRLSLSQDKTVWNFGREGEVQGGCTRPDPCMTDRSVPSGDLLDGVDGSTLSCRVRRGHVSACIRRVSAPVSASLTS
jgi:hypothetical protein